MTFRPANCPEDVRLGDPRLILHQGAGGAAELRDNRVTHPRWPTVREMRRMRHLVIRAAHPDYILWYSYFNIHNSPARARHWRDLRRAAIGR